MTNDRCLQLGDVRLKNERRNQGISHPPNSPSLFLRSLKSKLGREEEIKATAELNARRWQHYILHLMAVRTKLAHGPDANHSPPFGDPWSWECRDFMRCCTLPYVFLLNHINLIYTIILCKYSFIFGISDFVMMYKMKFY